MMTTSEFLKEIACLSKEERIKLFRGILARLPAKFWEDQDHEVGGYISKKELCELLVSSFDDPESV